MVALDGPELAECVIPHLETLTSACRVPKVVFVRVVGHSGLPASVPGRGESSFREENLEQLVAKRKKEAETYLQKIAEGFTVAATTACYDVLEGEVAKHLADYAENNDVDLILIASHGRSGVRRFVLGSVVEQLLRSSSVPFWLCAHQNASSSTFRETAGLR